MATAIREIIEWGAASLPLHGQMKTGDHFWVRCFNQQALVAVIDGVGHGEEAARAAQLAAEALNECGGQCSLSELLTRCHERLRNSRGAVMSLALLDTGNGTLTWAGVGNIEGLLLHKSSYDDCFPNRSQETLLLKAGVVGHILPRLIVTTVPLHKDDLLIFATDGIQPEFMSAIHSHSSVQHIARNILNRYALNTDDALVLVIRYLYD